MNKLEKLMNEKYTENGDKAYKSTGNNLTDLFFMTPYFEKHLDEVSIGTSDKEKLFSMYIRDPRFGLGRRDLGRKLMYLSKVEPVNIVRAYTKEIKTFSRDKIDKTLGKINNQIEAYRKLYRTKPKLILISKELELLFREQIQLMSQYEMVMLNDEPLEINRVFGLSCISTPALSDLEFEVR